VSALVRGLEPGDLDLLAQALRGACTWIDLGVILAEKLGSGVRGPAAVWVAETSAGPVGVCVRCQDRLRLLAVAPAWRRQGIGSTLLRAAEVGRGPRLRTGDEAGNYVAPGIYERDTGTLAFLEKRGYEQVGESESLIIDLEGNPKLSASRQDELVATPAGYQIAPITGPKLEKALDLISSWHGKAWAAEVARAAIPPSGAFGAWKGESLVAFAAIDGNNRGLGHFGPAATLEEHRGCGLGAALLISCLRVAASRGYNQCTISWIGPRDFYDRVAGISESRHYLILEKMSPRQSHA